MNSLCIYEWNSKNGILYIPVPVSAQVIFK